MWGNITVTVLPAMTCIQGWQRDYSYFYLGWPIYSIASLYMIDICKSKWHNARMRASIGCVHGDLTLFIVSGSNICKRLSTSAEDSTPPMEQQSVKKTTFFCLSLALSLPPTRSYSFFPSHRKKKNYGKEVRNEVSYNMMTPLAEGRRVEGAWSPIKRLRNGVHDFLEH